MTKLKKIGMILQKNSPQLLSAAAGVGVVATSILAYRAGTKADKIIKEKIEDYKSIDPDEKDVKAIKREVIFEGIKETAPHFIPVIISGGITIGCIVGSNRISSKRQAVLATAAALSEKALTEFTGAAEEVLKEKDLSKIHSKIAENKLKETPVKDSEVVITGNGDCLCFDSFSGRYFMSSPELIRQKVNEFNKLLIDELYLSMNEFYYMLNLVQVGIGDDFGYTVDNLMEISYSTQLSSDDKPCLVLNYIPEPRYLPKDKSIWRL